eukprot:403442-Pyramimonas_sp.AAC.1
MPRALLCRLGLPEFELPAKGTLGYLGVFSANRAQRVPPSLPGRNFRCHFLYVRAYVAPQSVPLSAVLCARGCAS